MVGEKQDTAQARFAENASLGHTTDNAHDDQQSCQTSQQDVQTHNHRSFRLCSRVDYRIAQSHPFVKRTIFIILMKKCLNRSAEYGRIGESKGGA